MVSATAVRSLEALLERAIDGAVIQERHHGFPITTLEYLRLMTAYRQSYDPDQRSNATRFRPVIQDSAVLEQLLDVVRGALGQHLHNDKLQSARIVTGGALDGFHIDELVSHLLTIAFVRGARYAANNFYEHSENKSVEIQFITLIDGVKIESEIEIAKGIRLVPIPNSADGFPPYIVTRFGGHYTEYYGRTLIIVDELVSPVFANPDEMSLKGFPLPFKRSNVNTEYANFTEAEFCEALSLSTNHVVRYVAWWSHVDPYEAYAVGTGDNSPAYVASAIHRSGNAIDVDEKDVQKAMSIYSARKSLRPDVSKRLRVPIDRWMRSKLDANPVDAFINLGTALEALYLGGISYRGELRFRLALHGAWHLGSDVQERDALKREFLKTYDLRSDAVHRGVLDEAEASPERTARAQELCLKSITKIIQDGTFPDWDQLVMGRATTP